MALFGKVFKKSKDDIDQEYEDALAFLNSDEKQNKVLPSDIAERVLSGEDCDQISGGSGEFGRSATNPIPCNGPIGEWTYLSRLRLRSTGDMVFFHRLQQLDGGVDLFELVSTSGQFVDHLYLHMYHPRKSRLCPQGYILQYELINPRGILEYSPDFPAGLFKQIAKACKKYLGLKAGEQRANYINLEVAQKSLSEYNS